MGSLTLICHLPESAYPGFLTCQDWPGSKLSARLLSGARLASSPGSARLGPLPGSPDRRPRPVGSRTPRPVARSLRLMKSGPCPVARFLRLIPLLWLVFRHFAGQLALHDFLIRFSDQFAREALPLAAQVPPQAPITCIHARDTWLASLRVPSHAPLAQRPGELKLWVPSVT